MAVAGLWLAATVGTAQAADVVSATVTPDRVFNASVGTVQTRVSRMAMQPDGKVLVTGGFNSPVRGLSRFNADGSPDAAFNANVGTALNTAPNALSLQPDGKIVVGGGFLQPARSVARFNADGTADSDFNSNIGTTTLANVFSVLVQPDGKILVGGQFDPPAAPSAKLARFNANGTPDTAFNDNVGSLLNNQVNRVALQADGKIVLVGNFTQPAPGLARFSSQGIPDATFNQNVSTGLVSSGGPQGGSLELQQDGKIVVVGTFTSPGTNIARFNADGTADSLFNSNVGTGTNANPLAVAIQANAKILVGGLFTSPSGRIARFNMDGTPDTTFNGAVSTGLAANVGVSSLVALGDGKILAVGGRVAFGPNPAIGFVMRFMPPCGPGIGLTTSPTALWQQLSLPCQPSAAPTTVAGALGGNTTGQLDAANFSTRWILWQRNATNSGNVAMALTDAFAVGTGHWIKSLDAPVGGLLRLDDTQARPTPLSTGVTGCQSTEGCVVLRVPSDTAGSRMIANPFPHDVDWSKVRVRVGSSVYTPSAAQTANFLANTIWIWNGNTYATWSDTAPTVGNLQYFKAFFVKVLPGGEGQTIDLLIPALGSTIASPAALTAAAPAAADIRVRATAPAAAPTRPPVRPPSRSNDWVVDLGVQNLATGWSASAKLGQWAGAADGLDAGDLGAMAPFAQPYLTVVFPRPEWASDTADYVTDLRPANGWAGKWDFEVRAQPLDSKVVLRWTAPAAVLANSRLIDRDTGAVIYPTDPNYAGGYPMKLNTAVRRLTWEYLGN